MGQESIHTFLITLDQEWPAALYSHLWPYDFAPFSVAPTVQSALDLVEDGAPRLVLVDLHPPVDIVIDLCAQLMRAQRSVKVVLVAEPGAELPVAALYAGVSGCINRDLPLAAWPGLLTYIMRGGVAFHHCMFDAVWAEARSTQHSQSLLAIGMLRIDLSRRLIQFGGRRIQLTPREFDLLTCLARNVDRVVTFKHLLDEVWGYDDNDGAAAQVRLYIARLRSKLLRGVRVPDFIVTERGIGYRMCGSTLRRLSVAANHFVPNKLYSAPNGVAL